MPNGIQKSSPCCTSRSLLCNRIKLRERVRIVEKPNQEQLYHMKSAVDDELGDVAEDNAISAFA